MFHDRLPARPGYAHNVESRLALLKPFRVQKELGGPDHLLLFSRLHGLERRAETIIGTGFDFDKHNDTTIQDDQIHLTRQAPVVSFDQLVSFLFKVSLRNLFPLPAAQIGVALAGDLREHPLAAGHEVQLDQVAEDAMIPPIWLRAADRTGAGW